jgi:hypothetical protein
VIDKSEKFNWLVRLGYFSRAILYIMLGLIALTSASALEQGTEGIFRAIEDFPLGTFILWFMVVGLTFYGLFLLCSLAFDIENIGSDAKGWAKRLGHAGSAVGHFLLAWTAFELATNSAGSGSGSGDGLLSANFGGIGLGILGLIFFIVAALQFKKSITGEFMSRISSSAPYITRALGGVGLFARGVVYGVIGWSLVKTGFMSGDEDGMRSLSDAMASLAEQGLLFTITAIGLLLFGVFSLILARYRIIPKLDDSEGVPDFRT